MSSAFFLCVFGALVLPPVVHRLLGLGGWLPVVFVQLLLGMAATATGLTDALQTEGVDLRAGPLADSLKGLGSLGVCLLIALGGTHEPADRTGRSGAVGAWSFVPISMAGFAFTAAIGAGLGWLLAGAEPSLVGPQAPRAVFAAATGLLLSVTALPVLMAILAQTGLAGTPVGIVASRCASLDDLWLWLMMAGVLALGSAPMAHSAGPLRTAALFLGYAAAMGWLMRPALIRWLQERERSQEQRMFASLSVIVLSAAATHAIGLHAVLGAFIGGAALPAVALRGWHAQVLGVSQQLLLPFFFVSSGLAVSIPAADVGFWALALLLTAVATLAKFGAVTATARLCGWRWQEAFTLGSLMQCKGLMELVAVSVLQQAGIIEARMASALAVMAVVSTLLTAPAVRAFSTRRPPRLLTA